MLRLHQIGWPPLVDVDAADEEETPAPDVLVELEEAKEPLYFELDMFDQKVLTSAATSTNNMHCSTREVYIGDNWSDVN